MTAIALIIITILVIYVLTRKYSNNNTQEELPIRQQIYLAPLKSVTLLSNKLFTDEDSRKFFCMTLLHYVFTCLSEETKMFCKHQETQKIIVDFYDTLKITSRKAFDSDGMDFDIFLNPLIDMNHKAGVKFDPNDLLIPVFQSFQQSSPLDKDYYYKLVSDWFKNDYLRFSALNLKFRGYVHNNLKKM